MLLRASWAVFACWLWLGGPAFGQSRPQVEIPYGEDTLRIEADLFETKGPGILIARGNVVATYLDATLRAERMTQFRDRDELLIEGGIELIRGDQWLTGTRAEIDLAAETGVIHQAEGFTDRELYIRAEKLTRVSPDVYIVERGYLTACEDAIPKWSFTVSKATIHAGRNARLTNTFFRVKQVPLFYLPWVLFPTDKKERATGLLLPSTGNSSSKGRRISQSAYFVLGRTADLTWNVDYFSERGFGNGLIFRSRPNEVTSLEMDGYFIDDRKDQGGASLNVLGETRLNNGFRAVANLNIVSNFVFRQVFSDNFFAATRPTEDSLVYLTRFEGSQAINILVSREETVFRPRNTVTRSLPGVQYKVIGRRLGGGPIFFDLDASAAGVSRSDQLIETPRITQRLDLFPQFSTSIPLFQGLRLSPRVGLRETFYSNRLEEESGQLEISGENLSRRYLDFSLDLKGWGLSRISERDSGAGWKHLIEPSVRYRFIGGINEYPSQILFDEIDAIANTNEVEVGLHNRFFIRTSQGSREWLSIKVAQKRFFDTDFGGAFREGTVNQFIPLTTLTGLPFATMEREFSPVTALIRFNPSPRYSFDVRSDYDTNAGEFRNFSLTGFYRSGLLSVATTYFVADALREEAAGSNQVQARLGIGNFERGFSLSGNLSYDVEQSRFLSHFGRANYFWDCCGISVEVQGINVGVRQEGQLRFSFFLKGIGSFGTIQRPDSVF